MGFQVFALYSLEPQQGTGKHGSIIGSAMPW